MVSSLIYGLFKQTKNTIFSTNECEKCPSRIQCWDSHPQPLEHESSPITTLPGLPPLNDLFNSTTPKSSIVQSCSITKHFCCFRRPKRYFKTCSCHYLFSQILPPISPTIWVTKIFQSDCANNWRFKSQCWLDGGKRQTVKLYTALIHVNNKQTFCDLLKTTRKFMPA